MYLASWCLEGIQSVGTNGLVLYLFAVFEVFVEEISFGGAPISHESLPRANDDTLGKRVSII